MAATFDHCNETRTCPACGGTLKAYADGAGARLLACMGCAWGIATFEFVVPRNYIPPAMLEQVATDRDEHGRLESAFREEEA